MTDSRQVILSETHHGHLFVVIQYHVADVWQDEDGVSYDEGYDYFTMDEYDLSTGRPVTTEQGDLDEMMEMIAEAVAELEAELVG